MGASHLTGRFAGRLIVGILAAGVSVLQLSDAYGRGGREGGGSGGGRWVGGHHHGGGHHHHGGRHGWGGAWWGVGYWGPGFGGWPYHGYGWPHAYAYGYPYASQTIVVATPNPAAAAPRTTAAEWKYCRDSGQFFPHAIECPSGWQTVVTAPPPALPPPR